MSPIGTNTLPSAAIEQRERREAKAANKFGNPVTLKSKIVAAVADSTSPSSVLVAEAAGKVRRVNLEVILPYHPEGVLPLTVMADVDCHQDLPGPHDAPE